MAYQYDSQTLDQLLEALGTTRRRYVLYYVRDCKEADVGDVTAALTSWLASGSVDSDGPDDDRSPVRTALHHVDLPKLSAVNLVSFDPKTEIVSYEGTDVVNTLLDALWEHERTGKRETVADDPIYRRV